MAGEAHKPTPDRMLTDADLDLIASEVALVKDAAGLAPTDVGYANTVDLYRAAAEAWRRKAGIVSERFDFKGEGGEFQRSQVFEMYLRQASRYAGMAHSLTAEVGRAVEQDAPVSEVEWWQL